MQKSTKLFLFILIALPLLQKAQGFQVNLQGQKQQGMGGAGSAFMQDGAAVVDDSAECHVGRARQRERARIGQPARAGDHPTAPLKHRAR